MAFAQQKAVTESGEEVILFEDGTWKFQKDTQITEEKIPVNPKSFKKSTESTFLLKMNRANFGIYLNPKKWSFKKSDEDNDSEYEFELKKEELYGLVVIERIEISIEMLLQNAIEAAKLKSPDLKVVSKEYRNVNGLKVLFLEMHGSFAGTKLYFNGYYFSNENGTIQLLTYTSPNLGNTYRAEMETFLNGFVAFNK
jgi:hypothetical protein